MSRWLEFKDVTVEGAKTRTMNVKSLSSGALVGRIKWFARWRQYAFYPEPTVFNLESLPEIQDEIDEIENLVKRLSINDGQ